MTSRVQTSYPDCSRASCRWLRTRYGNRRHGERGSERAPASPRESERNDENNDWQSRTVPSGARHATGAAGARVASTLRASLGCVSRRSARAASIGSNHPAATGPGRSHAPGSVGTRVAYARIARGSAVGAACSATGGAAPTRATDTRTDGPGHASTASSTRPSRAASSAPGAADRLSRKGRHALAWNIDGE